MVELFVARILMYGAEVIGVLCDMVEDDRASREDVVAVMYHLSCIAAQSEPSDGVAYHANLAARKIAGPRLGLWTHEEEGSPCNPEPFVCFNIAFPDRASAQVEADFYNLEYGDVAPRIYPVPMAE